MSRVVGYDILGKRVSLIGYEWSAWQSGWQCTNETYFFAETPKFVSEKGGFPGQIIMFWPKLFGFRCFGKLVFGPKWHKMAEMPEFRNRK